MSCYHDRNHNKCPKASFYDEYFLNMIVWIIQFIDLYIMPLYDFIIQRYGSISSTYKIRKLSISCVFKSLNINDLEYEYIIIWKNTEENFISRYQLIGNIVFLCDHTLQNGMWHLIRSKHIYAFIDSLFLTMSWFLTW